MHCTGFTSIVLNMALSTMQIAKNADELTGKRCRKCRGTGHLKCYDYNEGGLCYSCQGTGGIGGRTPNTKLKATLAAEQDVRDVATAVQVKAGEDEANRVHLRDGVEYALCGGCDHAYQNTDEAFDAHVCGARAEYPTHTLDRGHGFKSIYCVIADDVVEVTDKLYTSTQSVSMMSREAARTHYKTKRK